MSIPYVYDAGVLLAVDGNDRRTWVISGICRSPDCRYFRPEGSDLTVPREPHGDRLAA